MSALSGALLTIKLIFKTNESQIIKYRFQGLRPKLKCSGFNGSLEG